MATADGQRPEKGEKKASGDTKAMTKKRKKPTHAEARAACMVRRR